MRSSAKHIFECLLMISDNLLDNAMTKRQVGGKKPKMIYEQLQMKPMWLTLCAKTSGRTR